MNLIFMNSLEKKVGDDRVKAAQVSISEQHGRWHVFWHEARDNGKPEQDSWYEGEGWEQMLSEFRLRLREKMSEGFVPLLDGFSGESDSVSERARAMQMLQFYCESHENAPLFEELKLWRREQSGKEGKAPYIVATNRELKMVSTFLPYTNDELTMLPGFGPSKVKSYAEAICSIVKKHPRTTVFPLDWVYRETDPEQFRLWVYKQKELKMKQELVRQADKRKMLEAIGEGADLETLQQQFGMPRRELMFMLEELDKDGYDLEPVIAAVLADVPLAEQEAALRLFEERGDRFLKPVLQQLYSSEEMKGKQLDRTYDWLRLLRLRYRRDKERLHIQAS